MSEDRDALQRLMGDVIRVLGVYHGVSWRTELIQDLQKFYNVLEKPEIIDVKALDEALDRLESGKLIKVEDRLRGRPMSRGTYKDKLIHLTDLSEAKRALDRDPDYQRYMARIWSLEIIKK